MGPMWAPIWAQCGLPTWDPDGECNRTPYGSHVWVPRLHSRSGSHVCSPHGTHIGAFMGPTWAALLLNMGYIQAALLLNMGYIRAAIVLCTSIWLHTGINVLNIGYKRLALYSIWVPHVHRACKILDTA
ncbi:hypothetical protein DPMN_148247 [Dreissena polymorpha]|uniref:Uncharacterized protein n=1 Tax=Dreissena polymorpha TaxID=45954 RepID=A0A9D4F977_DREPO|nr:hypothetical protein DPMN_148247 [Dreissena polymorpha]